MGIRLTKPASRRRCGAAHQSAGFVERHAQRVAIRIREVRRRLRQAGIYWDLRKGLPHRSIIVKAGAVSQLKPANRAKWFWIARRLRGIRRTDFGYRAFYDSSESQVLAEVSGAYYPVAGLVAHRVTAKETLRVGDRVTVIADASAAAA